MSIKERLNNLQNIITNKKAIKEVLIEQQNKLGDDIVIYKKRNENATLAKEVVISIAEKTQHSIGNRISDLVTMALDAVLPNPYKFDINFVPRRGTTEADLLFTRNGNSTHPLDRTGGGAIDIASLSLRLSMWSINKTRPVFILDEPFKNLSIDYQEPAGLLLQSLAKQLGVQIIMVSHNTEIIAGADKVFYIENGRCVKTHVNA